MNCMGRLGSCDLGFKVLGARVRAGGSGSSREGMGPKEQVDMPETRVWTIGTGTLGSSGQTSSTHANRQVRITFMLPWTVG